MKQMSIRAIVMLVISSIFVVGLVILVSVYAADSEKWALYPANTHVFKDGHVSQAGSIVDRNGVVLAQTVDGVRKYNDNVTIRKATLHTVGDLDGFINTGLHKSFLAELVGYNKIGGVYQQSDVGNDIKLTLDSNVCTTALKELGSRAGTVGVYNYKTGEVICMVSTPTYDINSESDSEKAKNGEYKGVFINRFLSATYTPGSTFKVVTAAAGIDTFDDICNRKYTCKGGVEVDGEWIKCMGYHGTIGIEDAMAKSCNAYFSQLAVDVGQKKLTEYAQKVGFNQSFNIDGIKAATSYFNVDKTRNIDLAWAGMGQHTNMMNPLQYLTMVGAIASGGVPVKPYMIESIQSPMGIPLRAKLNKNGQRMLNTNTANMVANLMDVTVKKNYGKGNFPGLDICAKTGTAEVGKGKIPHSEFIGFLKNEDLPLAFVVVVENGGSGSVVATRIANRVLQSAKSSLIG